MNVGQLIPDVAAAVAGLAALAALVGNVRSPGRWIFAAGMGLLAIETWLGARSLAAATPADAVHWQQWRLLVLAVLPAVWVLFSLCYSRGNHAEFLRRWGGVVALGAVVPLVLALVFFPVLAWEVPVGLPFAEFVVQLGSAGRALHLLGVVAWVLVLVLLERTFRTAVGTIRWRIKFALVGFVVLFGTRIYTTTQAYLYGAVARPLVIIEALALLLACGLVAWSVKRSGTFEVEVYPSHAVLYRSLTILLAGLYLLGVGVLAKLLAALGEAAAFPLMAAMWLLGLLGLTLLGLSDRVRLRLRRFVSRHFQRPLHDYRRLWSSFSERTAACVNQAEYCGAVARLVSETFEALSVSVWLVNESRAGLCPGASTVWSAEQAAARLGEANEGRGLVEALESATGPVDLEALTGAAREELAKLQPDQFGKGGGRLAVPLRAHGELLGVLTVGDRVSGMPFDGQDLDLLRCVADHTAAGLLNLRLTHRQLESKQLEAFQAMSAFFIHDLKNAASTLTLTLENLRTHFDNAEFREDALGAIRRTSERIQGLLARLAALRRGLELNVRPVDLNAVVREAIATLGTGFPPVELELHELPPVPLDAGQMQQVIANFLLNARDALGPDGQGRITVRTAPQSGGVKLEVRDTGCGMSPEFVRTQLFRPFQSTKSRGLGIGMLQAKVIVEAHRGRIEVDSVPGRGTTVQVWLPLASSRS